MIKRHFEYVSENFATESRGLSSPANHYTYHPQSIRHKANQAAQTARRQQYRVISRDTAAHLSPLVTLFFVSLPPSCRAHAQRGEQDAPAADAFIGALGDADARVAVGPMRKRGPRWFPRPCRKVSRAHAWRLTAEFLPRARKLWLALELGKLAMPARVVPACTWLMV